MAWTDPIFDRTALDITNRTPKGFFNVVDWVRINGNTRSVNALVNILRGTNIPFVELPEPTITTIPSAEDINEFVWNIEVIRRECGLPGAAGIVPLKTDYLPGLNAPAPNWEAVNGWERDLQLIRELIVTSAAIMICCGVAAVGQPRLWQHRFRVPFARPSDTPVRRARAGIAIAGTGYKRQNRFRRYAP